MQHSLAAARLLITRRHADLLRELNFLNDALQLGDIPPELQPYREKLEKAISYAAQQLRQIESDLGLGIDAILDDLRSVLAQVTIAVQLLARQLATPVISPSPEDCLVTRFIAWIHETDAKTASLPAACCDGEPAVWPFVRFTPLYYMPRLTRRSLLHLPLLLHEYGHVAFRCHKQEMEALVAEIQNWISEQLEPRSRRNDALERHQRQQQKEIVTTWYAWAQEFFCDAVGLQMGGPCYLHAFSSYLSHLERGDFSLPSEDLAGSSHPVLWLRVRLLVSRAKRLGFVAAADMCETEWKTIADTLHVYEDYYGFFELNWQTKVEAIIDDMLTEASCRPCTKDEADDRESSPISVLNAAWISFLASPSDFAANEAKLKEIASDRFS